MTWLLALVTLSAIGLAGVAVAQRRRIVELQRLLDDAVGADGVEVIAIEIRNHGQLAASRSAFARPLAVLTPGLLRGIVHRETLKMMRSELAENGVEADVRLRRIAPPRSGDAGPSEAADAAGAEATEL